MIKGRINCRQSGSDDSFTITSEQLLALYETTGDGVMAFRKVFGFGLICNVELIAH
jgi:hypothetical protein